MGYIKHITKINFTCCFLLFKKYLFIHLAALDLIAACGIVRLSWGMQDFLVAARGIFF